MFGFVNRISGIFTILSQKWIPTTRNTCHFDSFPQNIRCRTIPGHEKLLRLHGSTQIRSTLRHFPGKNPAKNAPAPPTQTGAVVL